MEFLEQFEQLLQSGATDEELQAFIAQNPNPDYAQDDIRAFKQRLSGSDWNRFLTASTRAAQFGEEEDTGIMAEIFGDPESTLQTGVGPFLSQKAIVEGVKTVVHQGVLNKIAQGVFKAIVPRTFKGLVGRTAVAGAAGTIAAGQLSNTSARAPAAGPVSPTAPGTQQVTSAPSRRTPGGTGPGRLRPTDQEIGDQVGRTPSGYNVMIIDHSGELTGTPGALAIISPADLGIPMGVPTEMVPSTALQFDGGVDYLNNWTDFASSQSAPAGLGLNQQEVHQVLFPPTIGDVNINTPVQVNTSLREVYGMPNPAGSTGPILPRTGAAGVVSAAPGTPGGIPASAVPKDDIAIPAGAQLSPRTFEQFRGRTLVEWASAAAQKNGIPLNILYGVIAHESGWNPNAVGDNGQSFGLAQIYQPVWGSQVSREQALNPIFALNWTAQKLAERFRHYGSWDAAVAAHNSPVAADYLSRTGKFQNEKSARYVADIMNRANRSGLANYMFDEGVDTEIASSGGAGATYTPFQAPDPAASREYVRGQYNQMLGRDPTEAELRAGVEKVNALSRQAYAANLRQAQGGESVEVDPGAQFVESIRQMGEFEFHEDIQETRKFTDHAAGIAALLQRGL